MKCSFFAFNINLFLLIKYFISHMPLFCDSVLGCVQKIMADYETFQGIINLNILKTIKEKVLFARLFKYVGRYSPLV